MKKRLMICAILALAIVFSSVSAFAEVKKIILDTDMVAGFDDGGVLAMLTGWTKITNGDGRIAHPGGDFNEIQLLGVTVEPGNQAQPRGFTHGVHILEILNPEGALNIPIYEGSRYGLRRERFSPEGLEAEMQITGHVRYPGYLGWYRNAIGNETYQADNPLMNPELPWEQFYKAQYVDRFAGHQPRPTYPHRFYPAQSDGTPARPDPNGIDNAVDFIIHTINSNEPNTVSILAIGPLTNVALALRKDPGIAARAKEIVYMGGSFYVKGNASEAAEFNWWGDPEAAKMSVRTQWGNPNSAGYQLYGNQVISGLEAAINITGLETNNPGVPKGQLTLVNPNPDHNPLTLAEAEWLDMSQWFNDRFVAQHITNLRQLRGDGGGVWDVIAASWLINPNVIVRWFSSYSDDPVAAAGSGTIVGLPVDVEADYTSNYGRAMAFAPSGQTDRRPLGTQKAAIQAYTDAYMFWNKIVAPSFMDPDKTIPTPHQRPVTQP